jgi:hypothetical protein
MKVDNRCPDASSMDPEPRFAGTTTSWPVWWLSKLQPPTKECEDHDVDRRCLEAGEKHLIPIEWDSIDDDLIGPVEEPPAFLDAFEAIGREGDERKATYRDPFGSELNVGFLVGWSEIVTAEEYEAGCARARGKYSLGCLTSQTSAQRFFVAGEFIDLEVAAVEFFGKGLFGFVD